MITRSACLLSVCVVACLPTLVSAQPMLPDAIAIVADPASLGREIPAGTTAFQVYVVFLNPNPVFGSVGAVQFGIELDPGLELVAANSDGLVIEPGPLEYVIAYPNCGARSSGDPFVLLSLVIDRNPTVQPGAEIRLTRLASLDEPIRATRCGIDALFHLVDFGGVVVGPSQPTIAGFGAAPPIPVEGRAYDVGWETAGGGDWSLDGSPVDPRGILQFKAGSARTHELALLNGSATRTISIEPIREPLIQSFGYEETGNPDEVRASWYVVGALAAHLTGIGDVPPQGSRLVDMRAHPVLELSATNNWGSTWQSIELVPPVAPPRIGSFGLDPSDYSAGEAVLLYYEVTGASAVTIEPDIGRVPHDQGGMQITPIEAGVWRLTATNSLGSDVAEVTTYAPPPTIAFFYTEPDKYGPGLDVNLRYTVIGADSVWMEPFGVLEEHSGKLTITSPLTPRTYLLEARNSGGYVSSELSVESSAPVLTVGVPATFTKDQPIDLTWNVRWADSVVLYPDSLPLESNDGSWRHTVWPDSATTYRFVATNSIGATVRQNRIVPGPPYIAEFEIVPRPAMVGDSGEVIWHVYGADRIEIRTDSGLLPGLVQPDSVPPVESSTPHTFNEVYVGNLSLTAWNEYGPSTTMLQPRLTIEPYRNMIHEFYTYKPVVAPGGETRLVWDAVVWGSYSIDPGLPYVPAKGYRFVRPVPGTNAFVLNAKYRSHTQTDTVWVMVDPRSSFEIISEMVHPGDEIQFSYSTPGADRVAIFPLPGEVDPTGSSASTTFEGLTIFEMNAWYDGEREVIERRQLVSRPFIRYFESQDNWIPDSEPISFKWEVIGADTVELVTPSGIRTPVEAIMTYVVDPPEFGRWVLDANNVGGFYWLEIRLYPASALIRDAYVDPLIIASGDSATIRWDIPAATGVRIYGTRITGGTGEYRVLPEVGQNYTVYPEGDSVEGYQPRLAPVRVDLDAEHPPTLHLSASPVELSHDPRPVDSSPPDGFPRYDMYVIARDLLGAVRAVDMTLDVPEWLEVEEVQLSGKDTRATDSNQIVLVPELCNRILQPIYMNPNEPFNGELARIRLKQVGNAPPGTSPVVSIQKDPTWHFCTQWAPFGTRLPGVPLEVGLPLRLGNTPVPIRALPLQMRWTADGLSLSWPDLPDVEFDYLDLLRGRSAFELQRVAEIDDNQSWVDSEAPDLVASGPLHYQLVGFASDGSTWQSVVLRAEDGPSSVRPTRTRLVGVMPNPFNPRTTIQWELANPGALKVAVYDLAGRLVRGWHMPNQNWGQGELVWDGTDRRGSRAASGVYFVRLQADGVVDTKRVTLLK